ncbi:MAG: phage tail tube protein [Dehalococcoidales bacterium]|nr:phage tail tube protein [Dehalococcoidales bacterium]
MTASAGYVGFGTTLKWNGVAVAEVVSDIPMPNITVEEVDFFSHDSDDQFGESKPGKREPGELTIDCIFIPSDAAQIAAITDMMAGTTREAIITGPTAAGFTWTFNAWVKGFGGANPLKDKITISLTLKITGKPVLGVTYATGPTDIVVTGDISGALAEVPTYDDEVYDYVVDGSAETSVTVTVTAAGADEITVNGNTVDSGVASSAIDLTPGEITTITVVVKEDDKASLTYTIRVSGASA